MRVVAGHLRGRHIESPKSDATRPTTDKVREAVFNSLGSLDAVDGARVLDLFAGTGAMGIEAISRGAAHCTFVEIDRAALQVLRVNIASLGIDAESSVLQSDAMRAASDQYDLVIADPPYGFTEWAALLENLHTPLVVLESGSFIETPEGWEELRQKRYGRTFVAFLQRQGSPDGTVVE